MKRLSSLCRLGLAALVTAGVMAPGAAPAAEEPEKKLTAFKAVVTSKVDPAATYPIPLDPPLLSVKLTGTGEGGPMGSFTALEHTFVQQNSEGKDLTTDAIGVWSMSNGDAVYFKYKGLASRMETAFVITGGKGRYCGATGSGVMTFAPGDEPGEFICTFEGTISMLQP